jgi:preprotein translocase subunit SecD
MIAKDKIIIA